MPASNLQTAALPSLQSSNSPSAPLEARLSLAAPDAATGEIVFMPGGRHTIICTEAGPKPRAVKVEIEVNAASAQAIEAQRACIAAAKAPQRPFLDFNHEAREASFWPDHFYWSPDKNAVMASGTWSDAGKAAVTGKSFRAFSPTFHVDDVEGKPARVICYEHARLSFGGLVNDPAFNQISPLWARDAGAGARTDESASEPSGAGAHPPAAASDQPTTPHTSAIDTPMTPQDKAALQARIADLEQSITSLKAKEDATSKAELRAALAERNLANAELRAEEDREKLAALEAKETQRLEADAGAAVERLVAKGIVPARDDDAKKQWKTDFTANPALIARMDAMPAIPALQAGRVISAAPLLGHGDVREGAIPILKQISARCKRALPLQAMSTEQCKARAEIAREVATIYAAEVRSKYVGPSGEPMIHADYLLAPLQAAADTDTLGTLVGTLVSQRTLDLFTYSLPMINRIMTDFSDEPSDLNQTVTTRKVLVPSVQTYDTTLDTDNRPKGWATASNGQTTDISITLDELVGVPIPFSMAALSSTQRNLFAEQSPAAAYALAKYFLAKLYAICTAANYNAYAAVTAADAQGMVKVPVAYATYPVAEIDFARSHVTKIGAAFDNNEVSEEMRTLLLNPTYYAKACTDPSLVTFFAGQQAPEIVTQGRLPSLANFAVVKAQNFPQSANRVGLALQKNGLLAKTRLPVNYHDILPGAGNGTISQVTHPETGISLLVIQYTNNTRGFAELLQCVILGGAKGDTRGGLVITNQ